MRRRRESEERKHNLESETFISCLDRKRRRRSTR